MSRRRIELQRVALLFPRVPKSVTRFRSSHRPGAGAVAGGEEPRHVAVGGEAAVVGDLGKRQAAVGQQDTGAFQAPLADIGEDRAPRERFESALKRRRGHRGDGSDLVLRQVFAQTRLNIVSRARDAGVGSDDLNIVDVAFA